MTFNLNDFLTKLKLESMCGLSLYFIGFYLVFYFLEHYFKPTRKNYLMAVYVLGGLVFLFLLLVFFRNLVNMRKKVAVKESFQNKGKKPLFRLFHANWCGHCKKLKPEWDEFVKNNSDRCNIESHEVDEEGTKDLMKEYGVRGFPTIFVESGGKKLQYNGERNVKGLTEHLDNLLQGSEAAPVEDEGDSENDLHIMLFHADWCGHCKKFMPEWMKFEEKHGNNVKITKHEVSEDGTSELAKKYKVQGFPTVIAKKNGKDQQYTGERTVDALTNFVNSLL